MSNMNTVELRVSFPVACAWYLDQLNPDAMLRRFGGEWIKRRDKEVREIADLYGRECPLLLAA